MQTLNYSKEKLGQQPYDNDSFSVFLRTKG